MIYTRTLHVSVLIDFMVHLLRIEFRCQDIYDSESDDLDIRQTTSTITTGGTHCALVKYQALHAGRRCVSHLQLFRKL